MVQWGQIPLISMGMWVRSLALISGSGIRHCCELWCRSQVQLGSQVAMAAAVAVAGSCSSNLTPSLGTSIHCRCSLKKENKTKQKRMCRNADISSTDTSCARACAGCFMDNAKIPQVLMYPRQHSLMFKAKVPGVQIILQHGGPL